MSAHELTQIIKAADAAITAEDLDTLMAIYADDAMLVVKPGMVARGKEQIRRAFVAIAEHFNHSMNVSQGETLVLENGDTALVIMETVLNSLDAAGAAVATTRRATYVFRKGAEGNWLCAIDNSYGTDLLGTELLSVT
ncbi:SgcJ/EcaC family oxidoreductase [Cupriavidus necator]|uniref:SgcJ/EcaC family oxidoreductase n=1 Tax=Cupriavidus necator TaxID=106590 RepID=A0A367P9U0_CUPNE|nr:SgcJ/EcaC family oxidoreductase [Cupriavidus necator]QQX87668.1 SgcJ/EcaC family oxidoreductase [Cupriavidus necator]RCJ04283.1 SgcJ/EcaC family oxidoreductase [Cupriavidus necator]